MSNNIIFTGVPEKTRDTPRRKQIDLTKPVNIVMWDYSIRNVTINDSNFLKNSILRTLEKEYIYSSLNYSNCILPVDEANKLFSECFTTELEWDRDDLYYREHPIRHLFRPDLLFYSVYLLKNANGKNVIMSCGGHILLALDGIMTLTYLSNNYDKIIYIVDRSGLQLLNTHFNENINVCRYLDESTN